ncbi:MAG: site-2 protease family protein [Candidatus Omnitrophota bacterium]|nr:site-2 protease family protein [Candidatus Omnitrophota bacterium]
MEPHALAYYLTLIPSIVLAITVHECAHAWTALQYGDTTAYYAGRVTLNPLAHLDPLGTLLFFLAGFGWGKPTPVNVNALRHPRANLVVSLAGPLSNLFLAALAGFVLRVPGVMAWLDALGAGMGARLFVSVFVSMNLILAFFNLLPIWPLDGSHVVENLLPAIQALQFKRFGMAYGTFILLGIILLGRLTGFSILGIVLGPPIDFFSSLFLGA